MIINKTHILENICYSPLVYQRINKKLNVSYSNQQIENLIYKLLQETKLEHFSKKGKNFYVLNLNNNIKVTINSNTFRVITVEKLSNKF